MMTQPGDGNAVSVRYIQQKFPVPGGTRLSVDYYLKH
jgi:hypothetical protein